MSAQIIQCDYDELAEIMNVFRREADQTCYLLQTVQQCVSALQSGGWIGRGAAAFFTEMSDFVLPGIQRLGNALGDASSVTQRIADLLRNAEEEAGRLFRAGGESNGLGPRNPGTMTASSRGTPEPLSLTHDQETLMSNVANSLRNGDQRAATEHWVHLIQSLDKGTDGMSESQVTGLIGQTLSKAGLPVGIARSASSAEDYLKALEEKLNSVGDDAQLANTDLQDMLQKQQQTLQMLANVPKTLHDTAMGVIRKIGG